MKRIATIAIGILSLAVIGLPAAAQNQDQSSASGSLGDYARQIRKAPATGTKPKIFDNDNLPTGEKLSIIGPGPSATSRDSSASATKPPDSGSAAASTGDAKPSTEVKAPNDKPQEAAAAPGETKSSSEEKAAPSSAPKTAEEDQAEKQAAWKQWAERLNTQKEQVDLLARELDVLQREYQIRAAAIYADVGNRLRNETAWDVQDAKYKQQIADKQKELDEAKQKMEDMQEEARRAGVPSSVREP